VPGGPSGTIPGADEAVNQTALAGADMSMQRVFVELRIKNGEERHLHPSAVHDGSPSTIGLEFRPRWPTVSVRVIRRLAIAARISRQRLVQVLIPLMILVVVKPEVTRSVLRPRCYHAEERQE
jgi:hypothetical protein